MDWLFEMIGRAAEGEPPVTEVEFVELTAQFAAHDAALVKVERWQRRMDGWCANVRYDLAHGSRAIGAGRVAEDVRLLQTRYTGRIAQSPAWAGK